MSAVTRIKRTSIPQIRDRKGKEPLVCLTAYTTQMARRLDPHVDLLLVGNSLGMVLYGFDSTLPVTLEMMIAHGAAVMRGAERACVIVDLPFGSYPGEPRAGLPQRRPGDGGNRRQRREARRRRGNGGSGALPDARGIPVCAHVGLMPQAVNTAGGFKATGRSDAEAQQITRDAQSMAEAGAFAVVLEGTLEPVAAAITAAVPIPTIGIGASPTCDGQILVSEDVFGLFSDFTPRFVKRYADLGSQISAAAEAYAQDVRARRIPAKEHCFFPRSGPTRPA